MTKAGSKEKRMEIAARIRKEKANLVGKDHECHVRKTCIHGAADGCMYMAHTRRSRIADGYYIKDGKCGAYQSLKEARKKKITIPASAPVLHVNKLREI